MKWRAIIIILSLFFISQISAQSANNVEVGDVINRINQDSVRSYIEHLQNYGTRFMLADNRFEIANWIKGKFESWGFSVVELDSFDCYTATRLPFTWIDIGRTTLQLNVIATLFGTDNPETEYIIGAHYDSFSINSNQFTTAPGADDNASGVAAVLESARAVMESGFQPSSTLKFVAFAAEDLIDFGDAGSEHYARTAHANNIDIGFIVINDMIGFPNWSNAFEFVNVFHYENTDPTQACNFLQQFTELTARSGLDEIGGDLTPFYDNGYRGIFLHEYQFNSEHYHKDTDLIDYIDLNYCTKVIQGACGILLSLQSETTGVADLNIPQEYSLNQNYPNPFNASTIISYQIPGNLYGESAQVKLKVYDLLGNEIATITDGGKSPGIHQVNFDGSKLTSGVYFFSLSVNEYSEIKKMILLK
ncbi:M20/M25/M40 family metallo-hydrolase [Bacteroidota bacterium]